MCLFGIGSCSDNTITAPAVTSKNSQNMALAEAPLNHDINTDKPSTNSAEVVDDSALSAGLSLTPGTSTEFTASSDQISTYVVHKGDTLAAIAKMFNVSVNTILWSNDISKGSALKEGQQLVILPVSGVQYTVKKGDTLAKIAKKFNGDVDEIKAFNDLADGLSEGDTLIIPNGIETPIPTPTTNPVKKFLADVVDTVTQTAGYFTRPINGRKTQGLHGHNGIDFGAPVGTNVVAAAGGEVMISLGSGWNGGYGKYIVIKHPNGTQTLYGHLSQVFVSPGDTVKQGQVIGLSGNTGKSTGPHLHFEVRGGKNPF